MLFAVRGLALSVSRHQNERAAPTVNATIKMSKQHAEGKIGDNVKVTDEPFHPIPLGHSKNQQSIPSAIAKNEQSQLPVMMGDNVKVYAPHGTAVGSLILLMGIGADHSWTMSQWWYLDTAWSPKEQEWCCKDNNDCSCWFDDNDMAAVQRLRSQLRIVDAIGTMWYREGTAWYRYTSWPDGPPVTADFEAAIANVNQIIEHESQVVGGYDKIAIAGMSQGADLALAVGVRFPHQLGMVISQRGMLHSAGNQSVPGTPFILTGGDKDELVPLTTFQGTCSWLRHLHTSAYLKNHICYDESWGCHGAFSKSEWKLLMNAWSLMLLPVSARNFGQQINDLTFWSPCA